MNIIKKLKNIDLMLLSTFLCTIFYTSTYPIIYKTIMSTIHKNFISINQIVACCSIILFNSIWNKHSNKLFKYFPALCALEMVCTLIVTIYISTSKASITSFYILDTLIFVIVTRNIICGGSRLKALKYSTPSKREKFDNNNSSYTSLATIIGASISIALRMDFITMLWIAASGNCIDNVLYMIIYKNLVRRDKNEKNINY